MDTVRTNVPLEDTNVDHPCNNVRWLLNFNTGIAQTTTTVADEHYLVAVLLVNVYLLVFNIAGCGRE